MGRKWAAAALGGGQRAEAEGGGRLPDNTRTHQLRTGPGGWPLGQHWPWSATRRWQPVKQRGERRGAWCTFLRCAGLMCQAM